MSDTLTHDQLYELAQEADITGRGDMTKDELREALGLTDPFADVWDVEEGDVVEMNHLKGHLNVTDVATRPDEEKAIVVMVTSRGGRHKLILHPEREPLLRRWRAGDKEWMNNSTTPTYFRTVDLE